VIVMLTRFDPFQEFDRLTRGLFGSASGVTGWMPMDAIRESDKVVVRFDLPGIDPGSVDVTVDGKLLTVKAERQWAPAEGAEVLIAERPQGSFTRTVQLGDNLALDQMQANYADGVLTLTIPVSETAKPRHIEIQHGHAKQIEGAAV
jgi:HSP20 family protein